jgi:phosphate-selective porin OprO/OprP
MNDSHADALVFFGATGDLAFKKIFPALQAMVKGGRLDVPVIGAACSFAAYTLIAEHVESRVDAPANGDPRFHGSYLTASWVVTGESRPYIRSAGYAGGIVPTHRYGAWELAARYGYVDLVDGSIDGGILSHWTFGVNWWASTQWKVGVSYGDANLDRGGIDDGNTKMLLCRMQWLY